MMLTYHHPTRQGGSVLIVALSILLVLTILGVTAMQTTTLQERMAGNTRDRQAAFEAAEAGLRDAEAFLDSIVTITDFSPTGGTGGLYTARTGTGEAWETESNWASAREASYYGDVARRPIYMIQIIDSQLGTGETPNVGSGYGTYNIRNIGVYQITARGFGSSPNSRVMLQSYYGRLE